MVDAANKPGTHAPSHYRYASGAWGLHDAFPSEKQKKAYDDSLGGKPIDSYDPEGVLARFGMTRPLGAAGRTDSQLFEAEAASDYKPNPDYLPGPSWFGSIVQHIVLFFAWIASGIGSCFSKFFSLFASDSRSNPKMSEYGEPITSEKDPRPACERYTGARKVHDEATRLHGFEANFHEGSIARDGSAGFGTYDIAVAMGFGPEQAARIAHSDYDVDENKTPFKNDKGEPRATKGGNGNDLHWHFNRAKEGEEDTRLVAARTHFDRAVAAAKRGEYDAAEQELGIGLHSLQDIFAHGQILPTTHGFIGGFPDVLSQVPVGAYEAQQATEGYLKAYLCEIGALAPAPLVAPTITKQAMPKSKLFELAQLPAEVRAVLSGEDLRFYITDDGFKPTDLGFGYDLNGNGVIDGDTEAKRSDGQAWNDLPGGFDAQRKVGFIARSAMGREVIRHELMHALVAVLLRDKRAAVAMQETWQQARDNGVFDFNPPSLQEFMAEALSAMDDAHLGLALSQLRGGQPLH